ncbi:ATP F0F1 synthase subunit B [Pyruvatibacter sp.]|uniref:F0F1 ATP synthase subunit B family protein n=1 Tax=Pyruvatibacter sp. TaxID=1981328 RepID=UPI0032F08B18
MLSLFSDSSFITAISFFGFVGLLLYFGVAGRITSALDARADAIKTELEEARKLREEAQALLAQYQRKQRDAEEEAQEIVSQARHEAERLAAETKVKLDEQVARRTALAEQKIAMAESQAMKDVRDAATEVAIAAAAKVLAETSDDARQDALINDSLDQVRQRLV